MLSLYIFLYLASRVNQIASFYHITSLSSLFSSSRRFHRKTRQLLAFLLSQSIASRLATWISCSFMLVHLTKTFLNGICPGYKVTTGCSIKKLKICNNIYLPVLPQGSQYPSVVSHTYASPDKRLFTAPWTSEVFSPCSWLTSIFLTIASRSVCFLPVHDTIILRQLTTNTLAFKDRVE